MAKDGLNEELIDKAMAGWEVVQQTYAHTILKRGEYFQKLKENGGVVVIYPKVKECKNDSNK